MKEPFFAFIALTAVAVLTACFLARRYMTKNRTVAQREYELIRARYIKAKRCVKLYIAETVTYASTVKKETRSVKRKKTVRVQNVCPTTLEALMQSSDEVIRRFACDVVKATGDPSLFPSWYLRLKLREQKEKRLDETEAKRRAIESDFSSVYEPLKLRVGELARELERAESDVSEIAKEFSDLDRKLRNADKSVVSRAFFRIFNSKQKREALYNRHVELDSELLDLDIELSDLEVEMKECVHKMLVTAKERGERMATIDGERERIISEYDAKLREIKPLV